MDSLLASDHSQVHDLERLADLVIQKRAADQQISEVSTSAVPDGATVGACEY